MMLAAPPQMRPRATPHGEVMEHLDGIGYRIERPGTRPTATHRSVWRSRSDLLAGWLASEWKREQAQRDKEARQEWREAIEAARKKREAKEAEAAPEGLEGPDDLINKARQALAGLGDLVHQEAQKIGVRGTFNAAAVQGLAAGDAADRTAKATEETAKNTKKLLQAAQTGGLTFA